MLGALGDWDTGGPEGSGSAQNILGTQRDLGVFGALGCGDYGEFGGTGAVLGTPGRYWGHRGHPVTLG